MDLINTTRQFIQNHFPRNHLLIAGLLTVVLLLTLTLFPDRPAHNEHIQISVTPEASTLEGQPTEVEPVNPNSLTIDTSAIDTQNLVTNTRSPDSTTSDSTPTPVSAWREMEIQTGDNLSAVFSKVGLSAQDLHTILNSNEEAKILNRVYPGYQLSFHIPEPGKLTQLKVLKSPLEGYLFTLNNGRYDVEPIQHSPEIRSIFKQGFIVDSLFMAGQRASIPAATIMEMADIFGGVIDFMMDPRSGDDFSILYEEKYLNGEFIGNGAIIAAQFTNQGKQHIAMRYEDKNGDVGFYNPDGESMRKAFLRNPLDVVRITSNFNPNRRHPILNTIRAHKGTDYAAPRGTPVRATSDGVITWAARNGSFGKLVVIQHPGSFETKYAHLNDYAKGIKKGSRVKQGQVIGFVGTTGGSTGPHLHYEFLVNGVHKDWRTVVDQLPKAESIPAEEMLRFREQTATLLARFQQQTREQRLLTMNAPVNSAHTD